MKHHGIIVGLLLLIALPSHAQPVVRDGKEWLQPVDFTDLSWDDVNAVCPAGVCAGSLNGINVTGYTWASVNDVNGLFNSYGIVPPMGPGPSDASELNSTWAPAMAADFVTTGFASIPNAVWGFTRSIAPSDQVFGASFFDLGIGEFDGASTQNTAPADFSLSTLGVWLWRNSGDQPGPTADTVPVPTMGVYGLALTILALMLIASRRLSRRPAREG